MFETRNRFVQETTKRLTDTKETEKMARYADIIRKTIKRCMTMRKSAKEETERYYVDEVCLDVDHSTLLYDFWENMFCRNERQERIYRTNSGCFFRVISGNKIPREVKILSGSDEAKKIMNKHPAYICTDSYDSVFGRPPEA